MMEPATPYTSCANGCGVPAQWKVKKGRYKRNLCNTCATKKHDLTRHTKTGTKTSAEAKRKAEVLGRLGYNRRFPT